MSRKLRIAIILAFLAGVLMFSVNALKESDSFYHLAAGRLISETKTIPHTDVFSLTAYGSTWITHEWLAEIAFYGVWSAGGYWTLMFFCAVLAALTYFLVFRRAGLHQVNFPLTLVIIVLMAMPTLELWVPRPQVFAYLLFAAELYILERFRRGGGKVWLWLLPPLILLWANTHASVILGLATLFLYALGAWLRRSHPETYGGPYGGEKPAPLWGVFGLGTVLSLLNPNGFSILTYNFTVQRTLAVLRVDEWQPIQNFFGTDWGARGFALSIVFVAAVAIWHFFYSPNKRDITSLGLILGSGLMPFLSVRHVAWWPIAAAPLVAEIASELAAKWRDRLEGRWAGNVFLAAALLMAAAGAARLPADYFNPDTVPVYAADFIEKSGLKGPFFNFYNHGGYLLWRFYPQEKVFIDGRSEVFAGTPAADYLSIIHTRNWQELVDKKYKINYFILPYRPVSIGRYLYPLYDKLLSDGWIFVYWDDSAVILMRPSRENLPIASRYAIRYVGPWTDPAVIPPAMRPDAAAELQGLLNRAPYSMIIRDYTARFLNLDAPPGK